MDSLPSARHVVLMPESDPETRAGLPILTFADQAGFVGWLAAQPRDSKGAWLRFAKKGAALVTLSKPEAIDAALCHGWIDGQLNKYDEGSWLARFTPRKRASNWSEVNRTRALELIAAGLMTPDGLAEVEAARADGRWEAAYPPASTAVVPPDLQSALDMTPAAAAFFAGLSGANRYAILYRVNTARRAETRAKRIANIVAMLKQGKTVHG
ncbi:YdeI/OmpD-associated family protein [Sphingomonas jatrophae]|uniref:Uncharacterized conserved protein YdeI, YjbR/CyaY-like superfamily, DUF1801 family n=1 Tax=Sphingomonas jatrophae TaxID=1166337 RepID=A0A1I6K8L2_9SPHN|nr:YdeI/OmpD-associated family protein [Sphingomonas jatrophae]SFR87615.1 Uncharacterized conserved protein YdeI, YjbR/CyaY-like superfamily, DUF1801 family [Sphingomonas jatrophae]